MSYPILYKSSETEFLTNGVGILSDAVSCTVTEERNGSYELEMQYPVTGIHYEHITMRALLLARPNPVDSPQPFRIYCISRPIGGLVTVNAQHISYDLSGIPAMPFTAGSAAAAMAGLQTNAAVKNPFEFWTDKSTVADLTVEAPTSTRAVLGGTQGSVLDIYGGEFKFDRYRVSLYNERGADRGVSIRYGKNLTDIKQEENCLDVYTGLLPYWADSDGALVQLPERIVNASGSYDFVRILPMDFSSEWQEAPTVEQLRERAQEYIEANSIGVPKVSLDVSFVQLEQTDEYKNLALFERVELCDTVAVEFPAMGVSATAKVNKTEYDCILERYTSVSLGDASSTLADTILQQTEETKKEISSAKSFLQKAVDNATKWLTNGRGVFVFIRDAEGNLTDIACLDVPDVETAVNVWRWNNGGFGFSAHGYNGPFSTAITQDGHIVADFIDVGTLKASLIKSGVIQSLDGTTIYDLDAGTIQMGATSAAHIKITKDTVRWYLGSDRYPADDGPTGVFHSVEGSSWIGATSRYIYYGHIPANNYNSYYGMRIEQGGYAHFNVKKVECNGENDNGQGTFEANTVTCNNLNVSGGKGRIVDTPDYGIVTMEAMESPMPVFCDNGSGVLNEDGECLLTLHPVFLETVAANVTPQWHVTASAPVTVRKEGLTAVVKGEPGTTFDWLCILPQKGREGTYAKSTDISREDYAMARDYISQMELENVQNQIDELDRQIFTVAQENNLIETVFPEEVSA